MIQLLHSLRRSGRDYTNVVMNYLLTGRIGNNRNSDWLQFFDVVITGESALQLL